MNLYELKIIDRDDMYNRGQKAIDDAEPIICHGLKEVWWNCGGKLHRERCGYAGYNHFTRQYMLATRVR